MYSTFSMTRTLVFFLYFRGLRSRALRALFFLLAMVVPYDCQIFDASRGEGQNGSSSPYTGSGARLPPPPPPLPPSAASRLMRSTWACAQRRLGPSSSAITSVTLRFSP